MIQLLYEMALKINNVESITTHNITVTHVYLCLMQPYVSKRKYKTPDEMVYWSTFNYELRVTSKY
jgi:hypothetical protein